MASLGKAWPELGTGWKVKAVIIVSAVLPARVSPGLGHALCPELLSFGSRLGVYFLSCIYLMTITA